MALKLAIVGRPNVGKSTLFNRLAGKRLAIVDDLPGVTRDRREAEGRIGDIELALIDTAGFEDVRDASLSARMRAQTETAMRDADMIVFMLDARVGVTALDAAFADLMRRSGKPIVLVANKAEGRASKAGVLEAYSLGLGEPVPISSEHGEGMGDLYAAIVERSPDAAQQRSGAQGLGRPFDAERGIDLGPGSRPAASPGERVVKLAIIGRPNAGKSTLVNALVGEERMLTGPEAGITRDAIAVEWEHEGRAVRLIDTAGLRRKARVAGKLEKLSVADALRAIRFADVCVLVMDAQEAFEHQDLALGDLVVREGRALVFALAKWDKVEMKQARLKELKEAAQQSLPQARGAPIVAVSAIAGVGLDKLMAGVLEAYDDWNARVKTPDLNRWLQHMIARHPPPAVRGKRIKPRYMAQIKARPPTFVLICSRAADLPESYKRYLVNGLREAFGLHAAPIRLHVRAGKNPYADES